LRPPIHWNRHRCPGSTYHVSARYRNKPLRSLTERTDTPQLSADANAQRPWRRKEVILRMHLSNSKHIYWNDSATMVHKFRDAMLAGQLRQFLLRTHDYSQAYLIRDLVVPDTKTYHATIHVRQIAELVRYMWPGGPHTLNRCI